MASESDKPYQDETIGEGDPEPGESTPLIASKGSTSPNKCICTSKGCFMPKWVTWLLVVTLVLCLLAAVLITFYASRAHYIDTYGLPPDPEAQPRIHFDGRLLRQVQPVNYNIRITPYLDEGDAEKRFTFDGEVTILLECIEFTRSIIVHYKDLNIRSMHLTNQSGAEIKIHAPTSIPEYDFLLIQLDSALFPNNLYELSLTYSGPLNSSDETGRHVGLYQSSYENDGETRYLVSTQMEPTYARRVFPCFDEPSFKATFDIEIHHRVGRTAISNMPSIRNETDIPTGWNTVFFNTTVVMPTYLVAMVVSDFEFKQTVTSTGILFRVWSTADNIDDTDYALQFGSQCLSFFEDMLGIPYPLPKMDMIALPVFSSGAMENYGLITYRDYRMLYKDGVDPPSQQQSAALIISHELIHMWFGNLVTLAWWDDTWLNEGFARFYEYVSLDNTYPDWLIYEEFYQDRVTFDAFQADKGYDTHPTNRPVGWYHEVRQQFGRQSYERGSMMLMMMISFLGKDVFDAGIDKYLRDKEYGNAIKDDLFHYLTEADVAVGDNNVKEIMDPWLLQAGYPVVTVTRQNNQVTAQQERFLLDPNDKPLISGQYPNLGPWSIPVTYLHSNDPFTSSPFLYWLTTDSGTFDLVGANEDDWYLVNVNQTGYYRVNYDDSNWEKLIEQLSSNHRAFSTQNRAAFVDDIFSIAQSQRIDANRSLHLMEYMKNEMDYGPWKAAENALQYTDMMLRRSAVYGDFRRFMRQQISPVYTQYGWNLTIGDHVEYFSRTTAIRLACFYGDRTCRTEAQSVFAELLLNPTTDRVSIDIRETVFCNGIAFGDEEDWNALYANLKTTEDERLATDIKFGLACSTRMWILQTYMEDYLHTKEATNIISYVSNATAVGFLLAWDFAVQHFDTLLENDVNTAYDLMWQFTNTMNTQADKEKYDDFGRKYNQMPNDNALGFYKGMQKLDTNIQWMDKNYQDVEDFLKIRSE
ncbi:aminopeptidase N-like [Glandiceps talaboti]